MEKEYQEIKQMYDKFYNSMLKKGKLPLRSTEMGFWGPSPSQDLFDLFKKIKLNNFSNFLDLGSGDGKAVLIASLFTNAHGIESDDWLFKLSKDIQNKLSSINQVKDSAFFKKNFIEHDLEGYDIIFYNPDQPMSQKLEKKLLEELYGKLVVFGPLFHPRKRFVRENEYDINGTLVSIYSKRI